MNMNEDNIRPAEATQQPADLKDDVEAINTHCLAQSAGRGFTLPITL